MSDDKVKEDDDKKHDKWAALKVAGIMAAVAACSVWLMIEWHDRQVRPWALRTKSQSYSEPGAFGDSFAPVVGFMTALALGAAIASVLMQRHELELQREEMKEARKQWTAQAASLDQANRHAARANRLAHSAQLLEVSHQLLEIGKLGAQEIEKHRSTWGASSDFRYRDPLAIWRDYVHCPKQQRRKRFPIPMVTAELDAFAKHQADLESTLDALRDEQGAGAST